MELSFDKAGAERLLHVVAKRPSLGFTDTDNGIILRHDVDADLNRTLAFAKLEYVYGLRATFFFLDTADYWDTPAMWEAMGFLKSRGHEIAWHNNALIKIWNGVHIDKAVGDPLRRMSDMGFKARGSASHGDRKCFELGVINYEVFSDCPRIKADKGFPDPKWAHPATSMRHYNLEYEAYHVPHDLYLSESGGRRWNQKFTEKDLLETPRIQILIHPQWWKL